MLGMLREPDPGRRHLEEVFGGVQVDFICCEHKKCDDWFSMNNTKAQQGNVSANAFDEWCLACETFVALWPRGLQSNRASSGHSGCSEAFHPNHLRQPRDFLHERGQVGRERFEEGAT
jgi:hypothetical protein